VCDIGTDPCPEALGGKDGQSHKGGTMSRRSPGGIDPRGIPTHLENLFPPEQVRALARETGLVRRERKLDPLAVLWVLILNFGVHLQRSLAYLKRCYEERTETHLWDSSWYERFTPHMAKFLKACVELGLAQTANKVHKTLALELRKFKDVLIQDSTIIRLHRALAKKWPATRSRKVAAGVKVATLISAVANGPKTVAIHGERTSDVKTLRIGSWVRNRILLLDLGFYKFRMFARIAENGGFFVSRLKDNGDPLFLSSIKVHRGQAIDLSGKRWSQVKDLVMRNVLDAEVEIAFSRRRYAGKSSPDRIAVRMVAVFNPESERYHVYLTNIPPDVLGPEDIAALYRARWEIELVFKELKSKYALGVINTRKACIVECLIWTAILTLLVSRRLYNLLRTSAPPDKVARYTPLRWANTFTENGTRLLTALMGHFGLGPPDKDGFKSVARMWEHQALDPHVKRHQLPRKWWA